MHTYIYIYIHIYTYTYTYTHDTTCYMLLAYYGLCCVCVVCLLKGRHN